MYIYDRNFSGAQSPLKQQPAPRNSYYRDRVVSEFLGRVGTNSSYVWANEGLGESKTDELSKKLKVLSLLPHFTVVSGKDAPLTPSVMDPNIYDGSENYKIAPKLQDCLKDVMKKTNFRPIKVALVDLTKDRMQPEFAGSFDFKEQVFVASVPKIAAMLAVFQLRQDLMVAWKTKGAKTLPEIFDRVVDDWAATQRDPGGRATPFTRRVISVRGKLVFSNGAPVWLTGPKSPQLKNIGSSILAVKATTSCGHCRLARR